MDENEDSELKWGSLRYTSEDEIADLFREFSICIENAKDDLTMVQQTVLELEQRRLLFIDPTIKGLRERVACLLEKMDG